MIEIWHREILWIFTILLWIGAYYPYIRDILKWKTKPHIFSWIVFVIMDVVAFFIQFWDNAWPGAWWIMATWIWAIFVMLLAVKYWEKHITKSDVLAFSFALLSILFYVFLDNPYLSQIMIFIILFLAMYPTIRKSYHKPHQETISIYSIAMLRSMLSIWAAVNLSFLTIGLPVLTIILNTFFIWMIVVRKKQLWLK